MSRATPTDLANLGLSPDILASLPGGSPQQQVALDAASSLVDSYLGAQFTLPLQTYGKDVVQAEVNIAAWQLLTTRGFNPEQGLDNGVKVRYDETLAWLKAIGTGDVQPNVVDSSSSVDGAAGAYVATQPQRGWEYGRGVVGSFWRQGTDY